MIVCAAIRIKDDVDNPNMRGLVIPCIRHGDGFRIYKALTGERLKISEKEEGFVDNKNRFYTREEALVSCYDDLSATTRSHKLNADENELYSEDLY